MIEISRLPTLDRNFGSWDVVGIHDYSNKKILYAERFLVTPFSGLEVTQLTQNVSRESFDRRQWVQNIDESPLLVQAQVQNRDGLLPYWFGLSLEATEEARDFRVEGTVESRLVDVLKMHWKQLHTGNATTNPATNHPPFYATLMTKGDLVDGNLVDMSVALETLTTHYVEHAFNGQEFEDGEITTRILKPKHMGTYSSKLILSEFMPGDGPYAGQTLLELKEVDTGFGAPRYFWCNGNVEGQVGYLLAPASSNA